MERTFTCKDCGTVGSYLEEFPGPRCLDCHAAAPEVIEMHENMTAEELARMWGAE